jgi:hypothetical protein
VATTSRNADPSWKKRATPVSVGRISSLEAHSADSRKASERSDAATAPAGESSDGSGVAGQSSVGNPSRVTVRFPA